MTCERTEELLSFYLEGEVAPEQAARIEAHLESCARCSQLLSFLKQTHQALAGFPELEPSKDLLSALYAIPEKKKKRFSLSLDFLLRPSLQPILTAATVFLTLVSFYVFHPDKKFINRSIDRQIHLGYSQAEKLYAKAGSWADDLGVYKDNILTSLKEMKIFGGNEE